MQMQLYRLAFAVAAEHLFSLLGQIRNYHKLR